MTQTIDTPVAFDPDKFRQTTRAQWESAAEAWDRWSPLLAEWLGPATDAMLDMAAVGPGARVLDVAAGAGEQTLVAARRVGPDGYVLATDISPTILRFALGAARRAGSGQRGNAGTRRRAPRHLARSLVRCGHLARRPHLLSRSAARTRRHPPRAQARRALCRDRLFDARQERVLFAAGGHHPPACATAAAVAGTTGAVFARGRRRAGQGAGAGGVPRRRSAQGRLAGAVAVGGGVRALRARVLRRAASDDGRDERARTRRDVAGDRGRTCASSKPTTASSVRAKCWSGAGTK